MATLRQKIDSLDLASVRKKFLSQKSWWWKFWHTDESFEIERDYRDFLYVIGSNPGQTVVPKTQDLDDFWHCHILDTRKYEKDCMAIFGEVIHHNPHLPKGTPAHSKATQNTKAMYKNTLNPPRSTVRPSTTRVEEHHVIEDVVEGIDPVDVMMLDDSLLRRDPEPYVAPEPSHYSAPDPSPSHDSGSHASCGGSSSHASCGGSSSDSGSSASCGGSSSSCGGSSCGGGGCGGGGD